MKNTLLLSTILMALSPICFGQSIVFQDEPGKNIQRTLKKMIKNEEEVTIAFYGQSITNQVYTGDFRKRLINKFPKSNLKFINLAIGGWTAEKLVRGKKNVIPFVQADMIIFHCYNGLKGEYADTIDYLRRHTSSEILLWNDHVAHDGYIGQILQREVMIKKLAEKYACGFIDVTSRWRVFLNNHQIDYTELLRDQVHLNEKGISTLNTILLDGFVRNPQYDDPKSENLIIKIKTTEKKLDFNGIKVEMVHEKATSKTPISVMLNDKPVSELNSSYEYPLHYRIPGFSQPIIKGVGYIKSPKRSKYHLRITSFDEQNMHIQYRVKDLITGMVEYGSCQNVFTSQSKTLRIEPLDWNLQIPYKHLKRKKPNFSFKDVEFNFEPQLIMNEQLSEKSHQVTLVNGLQYGRHHLELKMPDDIKIRYYIVHRPWLEK